MVIIQTAVERRVRADTLLGRGPLRGCLLELFEDSAQDFTALQKGRYWIRDSMPQRLDPNLEKKPREGAGGTPGGSGTFFVGFLMMSMGWYWILKSITVTHGFSLGLSLYYFDTLGVSLTSGMVLIPLIFGVGIIFFNARNLLGWLLAIGSLAALLFGVIT
ncbi:MAG: hypothetical protein JWL90_1140, partial [Chthoniobacteraceae bacterium]|nr:hypothetical protein [Chthoniobacteraceae bacterium]